MLPQDHTGTFTDAEVSIVSKLTESSVALLTCIGTVDALTVEANCDFQDVQA